MMANGHHSTPKLITHNSDKENVQILVKQMLQNRFFIGTFQEKRYVATLQSYRDVILISKQENGLIHDLEVVLKRLGKSCYSEHWIGITNPNIVGAPSGYAIWTELPSEIFGSYWYKIHKVQFRHNEFFLKLKIIRPVGTGNLLSKTLLPLEKSAFSNNQDTEIMITNEDFVSFLKNVITLSNTKETIRFVLVLFITTLTGLITVVQHLGDFTIKLLREISQLIRVLTPIFIACLDLIAKIVGGFYLLILSMCKTGSTNVYRPTHVSNPKPMLMDNPSHNVHDRRSNALHCEGHYGSGVTIRRIH